MIFFFELFTKHCNYLRLDIHFLHLAFYDSIFQQLTCHTHTPSHDSCIVHPLFTLLKLISEFLKIHPEFIL